MDPEIAAHYALGYEQERLGAGRGRLEFTRTRELLARYLPPAPARIVDVGGGAGVYALPLAEDGYVVHLLDPVPLHVEQAGASLASAVVGDARDLPWDDGFADAALLLGPLYHLTERADRLAALREAHRVLKPGGVLAAAAISRFAPTLDGLALDMLVDPRFEAMVERDAREGQHRNPEPDAHPEWFTTAYLHHPDELAPDLREAGLKVEAVLAVEGPAAFRDDVMGWLDDPERREVLLRTIRRVEAEPSMLGATSHLLAIGRA